MIGVGVTNLQVSLRRSDVLLRVRDGVALFPWIWNLAPRSRRCGACRQTREAGLAALLFLGSPHADVGAPPRKAAPD